MSILQDRMRNPTHHGALEGAFRGQVGNPACGDLLTVYLQIEDDRIEAASFESLGSPYQMATASVLCECVQGQRTAEARRRGPSCVLERLPDLPERNRYLGRLALEALHLALDAAARGEQTDVVRRDLVETEEAQRFVLDLLQVPRTTKDIDDAAREAGILFPVSTARTLSQLRKEGKVDAKISPDRRSWVWWAPEGSGR